MARPSDYRQGYRKNTRNRQKKENKFYTKPNNGGILNKRMPGIDEIRQNIEAEQARAQEYENEWLDSVVNNADEQQTAAVKARAQEAKSSVKSWNEKLSEAYGLGEDGYWNRGTQKPITQQSEQMREHPEHAYGIGQYSPAAEQQKPAAIPGAAGSAKGREIMNLQDTLVHNPGMSAREKSQVQEKINDLTAEKNVLDWKDANSGRPTQENYQKQIDYYNRLITQAQDDMVNALGSGNVSTGDEKWYEYHDKVDELVMQRDAYNRGMMGLLDGDKTQTAEKQVTAGGEQGQAGNIKPYPWLPDEKDENSEDTIKPYPWSPDGKYAEKLRLLEVPISLLTLDELEQRKEIEIEQVNDKLDSWKVNELKKTSEETNDWFRKFFEDGVEKQHDRKLKQAIKELNKEYKPYIEEPADEIFNAKLNREADLEFYSNFDERFTNGRIIDRTSDFEEKVKQIAGTSRILKKYPDTNIELCETYEFDVNNKNAYDFFNEINEYKNKSSDIISSYILDLIPGVSEVVTANSLGQESDIVDKYYDTLGGEYTLTTYIFSREGNIGHGEFDQQYYMGLVINKDDVEKDNDETIKYPYNMNRLFNVPKEVYDYMKYTYIYE